MAEQHEAWEDLLRNMTIEEALAGLLQRVTTVVPHLAQERLPEKTGFTLRLQRFAAEWRYGLSLKIATLAVAAVLGIMSGHGGEAQGASALGGLLFGDIGVEDII